MTARRWDFIPLPDQYPSITAQPVPTEVLGAWDEATAYTTGDVVSYTMGPYYTLFRATGDSTGEIPVTFVDPDFIFSEFWELLAGQAFNEPKIVYQVGVFDPNPVGDVVTIEAAPGSSTATGGTFTAGIVYGDNVLPVEMTLPYDFGVAEIRAVFDTAFGGDPGASDAMVEIVSNGPGDATVQAIDFLASYPVTAVNAEDIDLTWDATPGVPSASITDPGFPGVGAVPGLFLGVGEGWVPWININGTWYSLVVSALLTSFLTDLSTAATIGDINTAATDLLANL